MIDSIQSDIICTDELRLQANVRHVIPVQDNGIVHIIIPCHCNSYALWQVQTAEREWLARLLAYWLACYIQWGFGTNMFFMRASEHIRSTDDSSLGCCWIQPQHLSIVTMYSLSNPPVCLLSVVAADRGALYMYHSIMSSPLSSS